MNTYAIFKNGKHIGDMLFKNDKSAMKFINELAGVIDDLGIRKPVVSKYKTVQIQLRIDAPRTDEGYITIEIVKQ